MIGPFGAGIIDDAATVLHAADLGEDPDTVAEILAQTRRADAGRDLLVSNAQRLRPRDAPPRPAALPQSPENQSA